jgi:hypothetical protein
MDETIAGRPMDLKESLKLERYKLVTDRQRYFTELARDAFASYVKFLTALTVGALTLVSTQNRLDLRIDIVIYVVRGILYLITFLGVVASSQIVFCLARWYGFRRAESKINPDTPRPDRWWWIFESLYIVAICFSIGVAWRFEAGLSARLLN